MGGREGGRKGERVGGREGGRKGGKEEGKSVINRSPCVHCSPPQLFFPFS